MSHKPDGCSLDDPCMREVAHSKSTQNVQRGQQTIPPPMPLYHLVARQQAVRGLAGLLSTRAKDNVHAVSIQSAVGSKVHNQSNRVLISQQYRTTVVGKRWPMESVSK